MESSVPERKVLQGAAPHSARGSLPPSCRPGSSEAEPATPSAHTLVLSQQNWAARTKASPKKTSWEKTPSGDRASGSDGARPTVPLEQGHASGTLVADPPSPFQGASGSDPWNEVAKALDLAKRTAVSAGANPALGVLQRCLLAADALSRALGNRIDEAQSQQQQGNQGLKRKRAADSLPMPKRNLGGAFSD